MLCKKCNTENLLKADYCQNCGTPFTQEEKDEAYSKTPFGIFEKIETYISYLTPVELIKGNKLFKAGVLVIIVLYSLFMLKTNGNQIKIGESNDYDVLLDKDTGAYYLVTEQPYVNADLHIPRGAVGLTVHNVDSNGVVQFTESYGLDDGVSLAISDGWHYIIQADFENKSQSIEVYVLTE